VRKLKRGPRPGSGSTALHELGEWKSLRRQAEDGRRHDPEALASACLPRFAPALHLTDLEILPFKPQDNGAPFGSREEVGGTRVLRLNGGHTKSARRAHQNILLEIGSSRRQARALWNRGSTPAESRRRPFAA